MAPPTEQAQTKWRPALAALEGRIKEHNMMALLRLELEREVGGGRGVRSRGIMDRAPGTGSGPTLLSPIM